MISNKDRSSFFGASDVSYIVGNWNTKSFEKWWLVKLGIIQNNYTNESMLAGTYIEHNILKALNIPNLMTDNQIILDRLRVNLDGNTNDTIYEIKTYNFKKEFKVTKQYYNQVQVQMYATGIRKAYIVSYGLEEEDYNNYYKKIDENRINFHEIKYDEKFIECFLPKLEYLSSCLQEGVFPNESEN